MGSLTGLNALTVSLDVAQKISIWQKWFLNQNLLLFAQVPTKSGDEDGIYNNFVYGN